ncbi:MAG: hypothetical protein QM784_17650 [Polyangiaceae bacterium]
MSSKLFRLLGCWAMCGSLFACSSGYMNIDLFEDSTGGAPNESTDDHGSGGTPASTTSACAAICESKTLLCSPTLRQCVECLKHSDCAEADAPLCNTATGTCVACLSSLDCSSPEAPICSPLTNRCVACATSTDCEDGERCQPLAGVCVEPCTSSSDCDGEDDALVCDPDSLQCVQCLQDADCAENHRPCDTRSHRCAED